MKKFLTFCLICIVTASLGLMTYRFLTLEESVVVNATVFEVNVNEEIPLEIDVLNSKGSKLVVTSSDTSIMEYDESLQKYMAKDKGGKATFTIEPLKSTSAPIIITVTVGDGSEQSPYFIRNAEDLAQIGKPTVSGDDVYYSRPVDANYKLVSDIDLSLYNNGEWTPIASQDKAFTGVINCNNHVISGLKITNNMSYAGLFAKIGANDKGKANITGGLVLDQATLNGAFDYAGVLAGVNSGSVEKVIVSASSIASSKANANVGGLFGMQNGDAEKIAIFKTGVVANTENSNVGGMIGLLSSDSSKAILDRSYCEGVDVSANYNVGGLIGLSKGGVVVNSYTKFTQEGSTVYGKISTTSTTTNVSLGGLVGAVEISGQKKSTVVDCYAVVKVEGQENQKRGQLVGYARDTVVDDVPTKNDLYGLYYEQSNSNLLGIGYIENVGFTQSETQTTNYPYIYDNLWSEATTKDTLFSHTSADRKDYTWASEVWTLLTNEYPVLDLEGPYFDISLIIGSIYDERTILNASQLYDLLRRVNNGQETTPKSYTLGADIDLSSYVWEGIGTSEHPFSGVLTCPIDETTGLPLYHITGLNISASSTENDSYAISTTRYQGLFGVIGGKGKVSNIYIENPQIKKGQYVGGIAGLNYGKINNCYVVATNTTSTIETNNIGYKVGAVQEDRVYIGGIAGYSEGTIANCQVQGLLIQQSNALADKTTLSMGGIVGANTNLIENCVVKGTEGGSNLITTNKGGTQYIGGIAGENSSTIKSSYASKGIRDFNGKPSEDIFTLKASTGNQTSFIGGIVGLSDNNSILKYSFADVIVEGTNVGGISSLSYGEIAECYSAGDLTGSKVGGLVYKVEYGTVSNCYVTGMLNGINKNSVKAGMAVDITLINKDEKSASVRNSFSTVYFDNNGTNYYDTACKARRDSFTTMLFYHYPRESGYMIDCIYDRSTNNAKRSNDKYWPWDKLDWRTPETIIADYEKNGAKLSYMRDCGMTTEQIQTEDGASVFRTYNFSDDIWEIGGGRIPQLKNVVKMK